MINLYSDPASRALHFFPSFLTGKHSWRFGLGLPLLNTLRFFPPLGVIDCPALLFPPQANIFSSPPLLVLKTSLLAGLKRPTGASSLADDGAGQEGSGSLSVLPPAVSPVCPRSPPSGPRFDILKKRGCRTPGMLGKAPRL